MSNWNERANDIFLQAVEIPDSSTRDQYVAESCGKDASLRQVVDELLKAWRESSGFLEQPFAELPHEIRSAAIDLIPERVGRYRILKELGAGGMGVVYLAQQETPVSRKVALKIIKPGLDTKQVIARFETERQVLAMMDHPNIARVFDAGATETGRPYFVMELVTGVPITEFSEQNDVSRRERLDLFITVCSAVQHAHQKGIIHRDLKPSNILVTRENSLTTVKVIDFGVAKAISSPDSQETLTAATQWIGTPLYMSPEQASPGAVDIDTRSDVYSLGVLLYELLTGTTPFDARTLQTSDELQKRQVIREYEPPRPSARVASLDTKSRTSPDGQERLEFRKLSRQLRGEIDWIVMKALEKDRERRYESASALAADLTRYLHNEPVAAGPPSQVYRLRKLARRNRGALTTGLAILIALVVGTAVAIWQAIEANEARVLADERLRASEKIRSDLRISRENADAERDRAKASDLESRRLLYASEMRLAVDAWKVSDVRRMRELLARHIPRPGEPDQRGFEWHLLWNKTGVEAIDLLAVPAPLYCVRVSPDQKVIVAAGKQGRIHLFDGATFRPTISIDAGQSEINALEFADEGATLLSGGDDGTVAKWDVGSGGLIQRISAHGGPVFGIAALPERKAFMTGGPDHQLHVWDLATLKRLDSYPVHANAIQMVVASRTGGRVAAGSDDDHISVWNLVDPKPLWVEADMPPARVNTLAFSDDGLLLAAGHVSGLMSIRHGVTGAVQGRHVFPDVVHSIAFTPLARVGATAMWIAVGDRSGTVHLLPSAMFAHHTSLLLPTTYDRSRKWQAHANKIYSMTFTGDGRRLLTAGEDGHLKAWDYAGTSASRKHPGRISDFTLVSTDQMATCAESVQLVSLSTGKVLQEVKTAARGMSIEYSDAARRLFLRTEDNAIYSFSTPDLKSKLLCRAPEGVKYGVIALDATGKRLAVETLSPDHNGLKGIRFPLEPNFPQISCSSIVHQLKFAPDGCIVFDQVKDLLFVRPETGEVRSLSGHSSTINDFAFSRDGKWMASVSSDRTVRVWDWREARELWQETAHTNEATVVAFSPDGETVATVGVDAALRLWRWRQNTLILDYQLMDWPVNELAFSSDGTKLAVEADGGLTIYDASAKAPPARRPAALSTN